MAGHSLTVNSTLICPHGGSVQIISTNTSSRAQGAFLATFNDTFLITGCPFVLPGPVPSPCIRVQWLVPDLRTRVNGSFTLSRSSVGLCLSPLQVPQGPVIVVNTQTKVMSQ